jgi:polyhydroxyalkanoate synthase
VKRGETADEWFETADRHNGSWWEDWAEWAQAHGGPMREPYRLPDGGEPAPGRYVRNESGPPFSVAVVEGQRT